MWAAGIYNSAAFMVGEVIRRQPSNFDTGACKEIPTGESKQPTPAPWREQRFFNPLGESDRTIGVSNVPSPQALVQPGCTSFCTAWLHIFFYSLAALPLDLYSLAALLVQPSCTSSCTAWPHFLLYSLAVV